MTGRSAARVAAPAAFLLVITIAVLLVRDGLRHPSPVPAPKATTTVATTTRPAAHKPKPRRPHPAAGGAYVTVQSGDTFYAIATRAGISVDRLKSLNPGVSPYAIHIGERIRVK